MTFWNQFLPLEKLCLENFAAKVSVLMAARQISNQNIKDKYFTSEYRII